MVNETSPLPWIARHAFYNARVRFVPVAPQSQFTNDDMMLYARAHMYFWVESSPVTEACPEESVQSTESS